MNRVLVISPHPDDESIGCGGTLRRHVVEGDIVNVIFLTSGENGGHGRDPEKTARLREKEATEAAAILGITRFDFWHLPDGSLRATPQIVERVRAILKELQPEIIYVTHDGEMIADHRVAAHLVRLTLTGFRLSGKEPIIRMYEVWTPMQQMDDIIDISSYVEVKRAAIRSHKSQCDVVRFDEAAIALNRYRGELHSWPGGDYAEIFMRMRF